MGNRDWVWIISFSFFLLHGLLQDVSSSEMYPHLPTYDLDCKEQPGVVVPALRRVEMRGTEAVQGGRGAWHLRVLHGMRQAEERELRRHVRVVWDLRPGAPLRDQTTGQRRIHHAVRGWSL